MKNNLFITKEQLINELGLSKATFYRRAKKLNIELSRELMSPSEQERIKQLLGAALPQDEKDDDELRYTPFHD